MYVPPATRIADEEELLAFIDVQRFATVVTALPAHGAAPFASHVPLMLDREQRRLRGHFARANPQAGAIAQRAPVLAVFLGPHAYISPRWYATQPAVPTWNYTAVHVRGRLVPLTDDELAQDLDAMVTAHEGDARAGGSVTTELRDRLMSQIAGFAIEIDSIDGKRKLGQHRPAADQAGVQQALARIHGEGYAVHLDPSFSRRLAQDHP